MSADPYSAEVRRLFSDTRHAGRVGGGTEILVDAQGVRVELSMRLDGEHIAEMRFRAWGCPHLLAAAEAVCEQAEGEPVATLLEITANGLMQSLAVPVEKTGRILVLEDAIRSLGTQSGV